MSIHNQVQQIILVLSLILNEWNSEVLYLKYKHPPNNLLLLSSIVTYDTSEKQNITMFPLLLLFKLFAFNLKLMSLSFFKYFDYTEDWTYHYLYTTPFLLFVRECDRLTGLMVVTRIRWPGGSKPTWSRVVVPIWN